MHGDAIVEVISDYKQLRNGKEHGYESKGGCS